MRSWPCAVPCVGGALTPCGCRGGVGRGRVRRRGRVRLRSPTTAHAQRRPGRSHHPTAEARSPRPYRSTPPAAPSGGPSARRGAPGKRVELAYGPSVGGGFDAGAGPCMVLVLGALCDARVVQFFSDGGLSAPWVSSPVATEVPTAREWQASCVMVPELRGVIGGAVSGAYRASACCTRRAAVVVPRWWVRSSASCAGRGSRCWGALVGAGCSGRLGAVRRSRPDAVRCLAEWRVLDGPWLSGG